MKKEESDEIVNPDPLFQRRFTIDERFDFKMHREPDGPREQSRPSDTVTDLSETTPTSPAQAIADDFDKAAVSDEDPLIGRTLGNYEIIECLGHGGFGNVYKAKDTKLDRHVALKFLRFPLDREYRKLFSREAKVLANLGHPSIVQIYTWGEYEGSYYFALEYLDSNADSLREGSEGRLTVRSALQIASECASALQYAHDHSILHRDVKPANILIDSKSHRAKLCDFGLARFHNLGAGGGTMQLAGSPPYMAPEQIMGADLDPRTDVYALGVSLYELLSGRLPFEADSQAAVFDRIRKGKDTPLSLHRPDLSQAVLNLVRKATAWNPKDRFQSARELEQAAQRILKELDSSGGSDSTSRQLSLPARLNWRRVGMAAAVVILVVAAIVGWGISGRGASTNGIRLAGAPGISEAVALLNSGQAKAAAASLSDYVKAHPDDSDAHYALAYAALLDHNIDTAAVEFALVGDEKRRAEGAAAVAHARRAPDADAVLAKALEAGGPPYPAVLMASSEFANKQYQEVIDRLTAINPVTLYFEWQRNELRRLLGQAYMKTGDYVAARKYLGAMPPDDPVGRALLAMAARQLDDRQREVVQEQIARLDDRAAGAPKFSPEDEWTSRPLRIRFETPQVTGGEFALSSGLADALSELLAPAFEEEGGRAFDVVDRKFIGDTLFEQELSSLSQKEDAVTVGKLRGARVMIQSEFGRLMDKEFLRIKMIDTETTDSIQLPQIPVEPGMDVTAWTADVVARAKEALIKEYPLQARLTEQGGQPTLNIGRALGVHPGMRFEVFAQANSGSPLKDVRVNAIEPVDRDSTWVELAGASGMPAEGWFVREITGDVPAAGQNNQ